MSNIVADYYKINLSLKYNVISTEVVFASKSKNNRREISNYMRFLVAHTSLCLNDILRLT